VKTKKLLSTLIVLLGFSNFLQAELVTVAYEAEASTVVDQPFGIEVPRLTIVRGYFTYESDTPDTRSDPRRGSFDLNGAWGFRAEFLDHVIAGSARAEASTETFGFTLRFNDGGDKEGTGDMFFDGIPSNDIELGFSIVGDKEDLPSDKLPDVFRFKNAAHTFTIGDSSGRMLLQFRSFRQVETRIKEVELHEGQVRLVWCSLVGKRYTVEFSTDLRDWEVVVDSVTAAAAETEIVDDLTARLKVGVQRGFYRVRELMPDTG